MTIPAVYSPDDRLVSVEEPLIRAFANGRPVIKNGVPFSVPIDVDLAKGRAVRAAQACVTGPIASVEATSGRSEVIRLGFFEIRIVREAISVSRFACSLDRPLMRTADIDDIIRFVEKFPDLAEPYKVVCLNSGYYGLDDDFPRLFAFTRIENQKNGTKGFEARRLERSQRVLWPGDMILV